MIIGRSNYECVFSLDLLEITGFGGVQMRFWWENVIVGGWENAQIVVWLGQVLEIIAVFLFDFDVLLMNKKWQNRGLSVD